MFENKDFDLDSYPEESRYEGGMSPDRQCRRAQAVFDKWLRKHEVVYFTRRDDVIAVSTKKYDTDKHQAYLVDIKPIKECEHSKVYIVPQTGLYEPDFKCVDCDRVVKSTGWKDDG